MEQPTEVTTDLRKPFGELGEGADAPEAKVPGLVDKDSELQSAFGSINGLLGELQTLDDSVTTAGSEQSASIFARPGEVTVLMRRFSELQELMNAQATPQEMAEQFFQRTKDQGSSAGLYQDLHRMQHLIQYRQNAGRAGGEVSQSAETDAQYARIIAALREQVILIAVRLLNIINAKKDEERGQQTVVALDPESLIVPDDIKPVAGLQEMTPVKNAEELTTAEVVTLIHSLRGFLVNENIAAQDIDNFLRAFNSSEMPDEGRDAEAPFNFSSANDHLETLETYRLRLEQLSQLPEAEYAARFEQTLPRANLIGFLREVNQRYDAMFERRQQLRAYGDGVVEELRAAGADEAITGGAEGLMAWLASKADSEGGERAKNVLRGLVGLAHMSAESIAKMIEQSDLSTFIQFLIYGGNGRTGGGSFLESGESDQAVSKQDFEEQLRRQPSELGHNILRAYNETLRDQGWNLSPELVAGLEQQTVAPDVLRQVLVSLYTDFLGVDTTDAREMRWTTFSQLMAKESVFKALGKSGLSKMIYFKMREEAEAAASNRVAWERELGSPGASAAGETSGSGSGSGGSDAGQVAQGEAALPNGEVAATPV